MDNPFQQFAGALTSGINYINQSSQAVVGTVVRAGESALSGLVQPTVAAVTPQQPAPIQQPSPQRPFISSIGGPIQTSVGGADYTRGVVPSLSISQPSSTPQRGITTFVPYGNYAQTAIENTKDIINPVTGELGIYQTSADINLPAGQFRAPALIGGGGRAAVQSGAFTIGSPETPVVYSQTGTLQPSPGAAAVLASPSSFSRLGSEAYGGYVSPLDNRTIESTGARLSTYPNPSNLATLASSTGVNLSKAAAPGISLPYSIPAESPNIQFIGPKGLYSAPGKTYVMPTQIAEFSGVKTVQASPIPTDLGVQTGTGALAGIVFEPLGVAKTQSLIIPSGTSQYLSNLNIPVLSGALVATSDFLLGGGTQKITQTLGRDTTTSTMPMPSGFDVGDIEAGKAFRSGAASIGIDIQPPAQTNDYFASFSGNVLYGVTNQPLKTIANVGVGIGLAATGAGIAELGGATVAAAQGTSLAPVAGALNFLSTKAAPTILGGLYAADVGSRATLGGSDLSPAAAGRLGTIVGTEAGPLILGGIGAQAAFSSPSVQTSVAGSVPKDTFGVVSESGILTTPIESPNFVKISPEGYEVPFRDMVAYNGKTGEILTPPENSVRLEKPNFINERFAAGLSTDISTPVGGENPNIPILDLRESVVIYGSKGGPTIEPTVSGLVVTPSDILKVSTSSPKFGITERVGYNIDYLKTEVGRAFPTASFAVDYFATRTVPTVIRTVPSAIIRTMAGLPEEPAEISKPSRISKPFELFTEKTNEPLSRPYTSSQIQEQKSAIPGLYESKKYGNAMFEVYKNKPVPLIGYDTSAIQTGKQPQIGLNIGGASTSDILSVGSTSRPATRNDVGSVSFQGREPSRVVTVVPSVGITSATRQTVSLVSSPATTERPSQYTPEIVSPVPRITPAIFPSTRTETAPVIIPTTTTTPGRYTTTTPAITPTFDITQTPRAPTFGATTSPLPSIPSFPLFPSLGTGGGSAGGSKKGGRTFTEIFRVGDFETTAGNIFGARRKPQQRTTKGRKRK